MAKFDFSGITSVFSRKDKKEPETTQQKVETAAQGTSNASALSGIGAAFATQANKAVAEEQKKNEVKQETAQTVQAAPVAKKELEIIDAYTPLFKDSRDITIAGALPGIAFDKMKAAFGEPIDRGDNIFTFDNGMTVEVADNIVKKISIITGAIVTPEGVAVDMQETILNTTYETADEVDVKSNGADYRYFNKDKTRKFTFVSRDGYITKIVSELIG